MRVRTLIRMMIIPGIPETIPGTATGKEKKGVKCYKETEKSPDYLGDFSLEKCYNINDYGF